MCKGPGSSEQRLSYSFTISYLSVQVYLKALRLAVLLEAVKVEQKNIQIHFKISRSASWGKNAHEK